MTANPTDEDEEQLWDFTACPTLTSKEIEISRKVLQCLIEHRINSCNNICRNITIKSLFRIINLQKLNLPL